MAEKISIAISAKDSYTQALTAMRDWNREFGDDLDGLSRKLNALNETRFSLKVDTGRAYAALEKAQKKFDATGEAADRAKLEVAFKDYGNAKGDLDLLSESADQTRQSMISMTGAIEKADNRASESSFGKLVRSGLGQTVIDTTANAVGTFAASAYGSKAGSMASGIFGGVASGALMGSVAGLPGAAVGAVIGGISGAVNAEVQDFKDQDEAFRSVVKEDLDTVTRERENSLANGTSVAASREQDRLRFSTLLGGEDKADRFLSGITGFASKTPYGYSQLTALSGELLNYGYRQDEIIPLLTKVGDAGSALGMSAGDRNGLVEALAGLRSAGAVGQNDLAPFLKQGIDVWKYLADSSGKTEAEVQDLVSKGRFSGSKAAEAIAGGMGREYSGGMEKQSQTYSGLQENLQEAQDSVDAARGEGYTGERKEGIQKKISSLNGSTGDALKEAYAMEGKFQASLENRQDELEQNALAGVVSGTVKGEFSGENKARLQELAADYKKSTQLAKGGDEEAELQAERDIEEAKIIAANEYKATDGYKLQLASDLELAGRIRDDTKMQKEYWQTGYVWGQILSQGLAGGEEADVDSALKPDLYSDRIKNAVKQSGLKVPNYDPGLGFQNMELGNPAISGRKVSENATGLNRVPYNNFPALLHEGETVLTGAEARSGAARPGVTVTGNTFNVRRESDIDAIASQLFDKIRRAAAVTP